MALIIDRRPRDQGRGRPAAARQAAWSTPRGSSFPSGHAAHSIFYVWLAVTIVLRLRPGMARGAAGRRGRHRADRPGRPLPRLPRRPLPQRRQRRLGAGRRLPSRSAPRSALVITTGAAESAPVTALRAAEDRPSVPALRRRRADLPGRLRRPDPVPALSAYGRIWEKAAAGFLSLFVLAALVVGRRRDRAGGRLLLHRHRRISSTATSDRLEPG